MSLWTNDQIQLAAAEAENNAAKEVFCITKRISLHIRALNSVYSLPDDCLSIRRITWSGKKLTPEPFVGILEFPLTNPAGVIGAFDADAYSAAFFVSASNSTPSGGDPYIYFYSGYGENLIKFYPTPTINVAASTGNLFKADVIRTSVVIEYYALPDFTGMIYRLPQYIARRLIKSYVLFKLMSLEGPGQDLMGAARHNKRYLALLEDLRHINAGIFVAKVKTRTPNANSFPTSIARPRLPSNYGTIVE